MKSKYMITFQADLSFPLQEIESLIRNKYPENLVSDLKIELDARPVNQRVLAEYICKAVLGEKEYDRLVSVGKVALPELIKLAIVKDYTRVLLTSEGRLTLANLNRELEEKGVLE